MLTTSALVIGGSLAGMCAARVLSDFVDRVTIIEREVWERHMTALGAAVDPGARRATFMISGCPLRDSRGAILRVGTSRIRIRGETRPCERMDEALPGLRAVMSEPWGGGAFGEVLSGGTVRVGDPVAWETEPPEGS